MLTDEIIDVAIKMANKDQYGQTPIFNKTIQNLFPNENIDDVIEYLKTSKKYTLSTYGFKYGTYKAITLK